MTLKARKKTAPAIEHQVRTNSSRTNSQLRLSPSTIGVLCGGFIAQVTGITQGRMLVPHAWRENEEEEAMEMRNGRGKGGR
eukprot:736670-Hanusia_phi.AAC.1